MFQTATGTTPVGDGQRRSEVLGPRSRRTAVGHEGVQAGMLTDTRTHMKETCEYNLDMHVRMRSDVCKVMHCNVTRCNVMQHDVFSLFIEIIIERAL